MTETETTLTNVAERFLRSFERCERNDGSRFWATKANAPEWATEVVRELHDGELPNDWRYEAIVTMADDFFQALCEGKSADEAGESISTEPSVYNGELLQWLQDNMGRIDQDFELDPSNDPFELIRQAQLQCLCSMANQLQFQLEQIAAEGL